MPVNSSGPVQQPQSAGSFSQVSSLEAVAVQDASAQQHLASSLAEPAGRPSEPQYLGVEPAPEADSWAEAAAADSSSGDVSSWQAAMAWELHRASRPVYGVYDLAYAASLGANLGHAHLLLALQAHSQLRPYV